LPARLRRLYRRLVPPQPRWQAIVGVVLALAVASGIAVQSLWPGGGGPELPRASIVVMPFNNFSGDPSQNYVADAITDDVTTDLARLKGTFVIARNTAFTFKGRSIDARDVGKECGVRYMLEGSIVRIGNRIATNVQLIDTQTGAHVWADRFETDITDLLALQSAVTIPPPTRTRSICGCGQWRSRSAASRPSARLKLSTCWNSLSSLTPMPPRVGHGSRKS
jgi:TolB-like protein